MPHMYNYGIVLFQAALTYSPRYFTILMCILPKIVMLFIFLDFIFISIRSSQQIKFSVCFQFLWVQL